MPSKPLRKQAKSKPKKPRKSSPNIGQELLDLARECMANMTEADWAKVPRDLSSSYKRRRLMATRKAAS